MKAAMSMASSPATLGVGGDVVHLPQPPADVTGVESLLLPLQNSQLSSLVAISSPMPCSQIVDGEVDLTFGTKAFKINYTPIKLSARFQHAVENLIFNAFSTALGLQSSKNYVHVKLTKILLYPKGAFFGPYFLADDMNKHAGLFAMLVEHLPNLFSGGTLVTDDASRTKIIDSLRNSDNTFYLSSVFTDRIHEIREVVGRFKFGLTYNLANESYLGGASLLQLKKKKTQRQGETENEINMPYQWLRVWVDKPAKTTLSQLDFKDNKTQNADKNSNELLETNGTVFTHDYAPNLEYVNCSASGQISYDVYKKALPVFCPRFHTPTVIGRTSVKATAKTIKDLCKRGDMHTAVALLRRTVHFVRQHAFDLSCEKASGTLCASFINRNRGGNGNGRSGIGIRNTDANVNRNRTHNACMLLEPLSESITHLLDAASFVGCFDTDSIEKVFRLVADDGIGSKRSLLAILRAGTVLGIWVIQRNRFNEIERDHVMKEILQDVDELEDTAVNHHRHHGTSGGKGGISTTTTSKATETGSIYGDAAIAASFFSSENVVEDVNRIRDDSNGEIIAENHTPDDVNESNDLTINGGCSSRDATGTGVAENVDLRTKFYTAIVDAVRRTPRARQDHCITLAFTVLLRCRALAFTVTENDFRNGHAYGQGQGSANWNRTASTDNTSTRDMYCFAQNIVTMCVPQILSKLTDKVPVRDVLSEVREKTVYSCMYMILIFKCCSQEREHLVQLCSGTNGELHERDIPNVELVLRACWYISTEGRGKNGLPLAEVISSADGRGGVTQQERTIPFPPIVYTNYISFAEWAYIRICFPYVSKVQKMLKSIHLERIRLEEEQKQAQRSHAYAKAQDIAAKLREMKNTPNLTVLCVIHTWKFLQDVLFMDTLGYLPPWKSQGMITVDEYDHMNTMSENSGSSSNDIESDNDDQIIAKPFSSAVLGPFVKLLQNRLATTLIECNSTIGLAPKLLWKTMKFGQPMVYSWNGVRKLARYGIDCLQWYCSGNIERKLTRYVKGRVDLNINNRIKNDPAHQASPIRREVPSPSCSATSANSITIETTPIQTMPALNIGQPVVPTETPPSSPLPSMDPSPSPPPPSPSSHLLIPPWIYARRNAKEVPGHPDVTQFLRSPCNEQYKVNFASVREAEEFAALFEAENEKIKSRGYGNVAAMASEIVSRRALVRFYETESDGGHENNNYDNNDNGHDDSDENDGYEDDDDDDDDEEDFYRDDDDDDDTIISYDEFEDDDDDIIDGYDDDDDDEDTDDDDDDDDNDDNDNEEDDTDRDGVDGDGWDDTDDDEEQGWGLVSAVVVETLDSCAYVLLEKNLKDDDMVRKSRLFVLYQEMMKELLYLKRKFGF